MSRMRRQHNYDLWRCQLCDHGPECSMRDSGACCYAHSLGEVLPRRERISTYRALWRHGVDRFYGQRMTDHQIARINWYWENYTAPYERLVWCQGMQWWHEGHGLMEHPDLGWDLGITLISTRKV